MTTKAVAYTVRQMAPRCSAIPGLMWARRDPGRARAELSRVAALAEEAGGLVPRTEKDFHPDAMANLWFVRAAHEFAQAAAGEKVLMDFFHDALLPVWRNPAGFTKEQLKSIKAPSMITLGEHDEIIYAAQIEEMGKLIPKGRSLIFKDASHFVMWQDPESFNRALVEFLTAPE